MTPVLLPYAFFVVVLRLELVVIVVGLTEVVAEADSTVLVDWEAAGSDWEVVEGG
jgi:hypothetical protein